MDRIELERLAAIATEARAKWVAFDEHRDEDMTISARVDIDLEAARLVTAAARARCDYESALREFAIERKDAA